MKEIILDLVNILKNENLQDFESDKKTQLKVAVELGDLEGRIKRSNNPVQTLTEKIQEMVSETFFMEAGNPNYQAALKAHMFIETIYTYACNQ